MKINLLPQRVRIGRLGKHRVSLMAKILLISIVVSPLGASISVVARDKNGKKAFSRPSQALVQGIAHQINLLNKDIDRLVREEQNAAHNYRVRSELVHILSSLAVKVPRDITITAIKYTPKENIFIGVARNQEALLRFFQILNQRDFVGVPNIRKTSLNNAHGILILEFEVGVVRSVNG